MAYMEALRLGSGPALLRHQGSIFGELPFERIRFVFFQRSSAVAGYAARSLADGIIAGEEFAHHILAYKDVAYLDYGSEAPVHIIL